VYPQDWVLNIQDERIFATAIEQVDLAGMRLANIMPSLSRSSSSGPDAGLEVDSVLGVGLLGRRAHAGGMRGT
jgi:hypothetical protein